MTPSPTVAYDANGNTLTDPSGKSYTWDFENLLVQAVVPGTGTTTFKYDPFGRRIQKSGPLGTTNYLYDGYTLLEEMDSAGNVLARYTQGTRIDQPLAELRSGNTGFYEQEALGSVSSLSNGAGSLTNTYSYDSFGNLTASTGTLANPFQFTGREFDPETGIYEYRMRYYDPSVGRFLSEDPIRFNGGNNFYRYAADSPLNFNDPFGLEPEGCTDCKGQPKQGLSAGKSCCGNETPLSPDSQSPYPNSYYYRGVSANWMYQLGGNNPWGNRVRSCLLCMYRHGVPAPEAHAFCYSNASDRTSAWDTAEGYSAAYFSAFMFFIQNNQGPPHGH